jgi:hypothetical protein
VGDARGFQVSPAPSLTSIEPENPKAIPEHQLGPSRDVRGEPALGASMSLPWRPTATIALRTQTNLRIFDFDLV